MEYDGLPEYCRYQDDGCELSPSCLSCSLSTCVEEYPGGKQRWFKEGRNQEVARLYYSGKSVKALAQVFGVSQRTVQRALNRRAENE
jgi:transposase-like protein